MYIPRLSGYRMNLKSGSEATYIAYLSLSFSVLMTYHQLKRTNIIMSYVENARVLQGTVDLCKVPHTMLKPMGTLHYAVGVFHCSM